jgi:hypothetical protein
MMIIDTTPQLGVIVWALIGLLLVSGAAIVANVLFCHWRRRHAAADRHAMSESSLSEERFRAGSYRLRSGVI